MRMIGHILLPALALGLLGPVSATAQSSTTPADIYGSAPSVGEELLVRYQVDTPGPVPRRSTRTVRVEFVSANPDQLVGRSRDRLLVIDSRSIRGVRRRTGTRPASAPAMVMGSAAGFAAGFLMGAAAPSGRRGAVNDGLVTGVLVGAPLGAFVAWVASRSRPLYEEVAVREVQPTVGVNPSGRVGVSLAVATR